MQCRDTYAVGMLLGHYHRMTCAQLWLKTGTANKRQYIPIHDIVDHVPFNVDTRESIPIPIPISAFHALAGSVTTSYIAGHSKKSAWKTFQVHHHLLKNLGKCKLSTETSQNAEQCCTMSTV